MLKVQNPGDNLGLFHQNLADSFSKLVVEDLAKAAVESFHKKEYEQFGFSLGAIIQ
jgi:surfactin synthase thioesterase subunit